MKRIAIGSIILCLWPFVLPPETRGAGGLPYCDEPRGGLCVERHPVNTYLVAWLVPTGNDRERDIMLRFENMTEEECRNLPRLARCFRIGAYTESQLRDVRANGDKPEFGPGGPTKREYIQRYMPKSRQAETVTMDVQFSTAAGYPYTLPLLGACNSPPAHADCLSVWIEPVEAQK